MFGLKRGEIGDIFAVASLAGMLLGMVLALLKWWLL
jgi:hypothetical protein